MGAPWKPASAGPLVTSLLDQRKRSDDAAKAARDAVDDVVSRRRRNARAAGALALLAVSAAVFVGLSTAGSELNRIALYVVPLLAGACGAIVRSVTDEGKDPWIEGFFGLIAGAATALLFVASQLATSPGALSEPGVELLAVLMFVVGLIAGLTTDEVFAKLRKQDVADVSPLNKP